MEVIIEFHTWRIRHHHLCVAYHLVGKRLVEPFHTESIGSTYHLHHLLLDKTKSGRTREQTVGLSVERHGHSVERHIPHSLLPSGLAILHISHSNTGSTHIVKHSGITGSITTSVITYIYITIALMVDNTRQGLCRTDKGKSGGKLHTWKHLFNRRFHTYSILNEQYNGVRLQQRRKQFGE